MFFSFIHPLLDSVLMLFNFDSCSHSCVLFGQPFFTIQIPATNSVYEEDNVLLWRKIVYAIKDSWIIMHIYSILFRMKLRKSRIKFLNNPWKLYCCIWREISWGEIPTTNKTKISFLLYLHFNPGFWLLLENINSQILRKTWIIEGWNMMGLKNQLYYL